MTFTGSITDTSTGLQYMNARFYDPQTARFLSQDTYSGNPYDPWTQHLYAYSGNNPTSMVDPTGHFFNLIAAAIGAVAGAVIGVVGNGIANVANGNDFFDNAGKAALIGGAVGAVIGITCGAVLAAGGVTAAISSAGAAIGSAASSVAAAARTAATAVGTFVASNASKVASAASNAWSSARNFFYSAGSSISKIATKAKPVVKKVVQTVKNVVKKVDTTVHSSGNQHGDATHYEQITDKVNTMSNSAKYTDIYVNNGLSNVINNFSKNYRPDIMGVRGNGIIDVFEVQSPSQSIEFMQEKLILLANELGNHFGKASEVIWRIVK